MLKLFVITGVRLPKLACISYPDDALVILRSVNVATPFDAAWVVVPFSVAFPGLVFMAIVTEEPESLVHIFP